MEKTVIQSKLATIKNGAYTNITFVSDITPNKDNKDHKIQKVISAVVRLGVTYSHSQVESIQARKVADENGVPLTEHLPWGEWDPECGYLIAHKGGFYLRCTVSRSPKHHRTVTYMLDGKEVSKEEIIPMTRASEWTPRDREEYVFNPKIENVLSLGKEGK